MEGKGKGERGKNTKGKLSIRVLGAIALLMSSESRRDTSQNIQCYSRGNCALMSAEEEEEKGRAERQSEIPLEQRVLMQPRAIWFMSRGKQRQVGTSCWTSTSPWLPVRDAKLIRQAARAATQTHLYIYVCINIYRYIFCNQLGAGISFEQ